MNRACLSLVALTAAILVFAAASQATQAASTSTVSLQQAPTVERQTEGEAPQSSEDTRVWVQAYTVLAAGGAAALFLLLFLVRIALGRAPVAPPPQEDTAPEAAHH